MLLTNWLSTDLVVRIGPWPISHIPHIRILAVPLPLTCIDAEMTIEAEGGCRLLTCCIIVNSAFTGFWSESS